VIRRALLRTPLLRRRLLPYTRALASIAVLLWSLASIGQTTPSMGARPQPAAVPAARQARNVAVITIEGPIDDTTYTSVRRRLTLAQRAGADAVVFELETPGGELGAVLGICTEIKACPIKNTVAWVHRTAYSGGAVIALACREMVVADPCTLGDALPISITSFGMLNSLPEHERQKFLSPLIAELVDSARRNHYDELLVQGIAARGVELWLVQNKETGDRLFINRDEYKLVFGEEPTGGATTLASAPSLPEDAEPAHATERPQGLDELLRQFVSRPRPHKQRPHRPSDAPIPPPSPDDPNRFIPATPRLDAISGEVTIGQDLPVTRPAITPADRGRWTLVEHVSSGAGPFVFHAAELRHFALASATINSDQELIAFFGAKNLIRLKPTWSEGLVTVLTNMWVRALLVVIFLVGLFVEMTHPGLILPGAIATTAFLCLVLPPILIDLSAWWTLASMLCGIILLMLEIFVIPGFGVAGILGLLLLFAGLIGTFVPAGSFFPDTPGQQHDLVYGVATLLTAMVTSGAIMFFFARHFRSLPVFNRLVLQDPVPSDDDAGDEMFAAMAHGPGAGAVRVGMTGVAITPLRPAGRVQLGDRIIDVVSEIGYIPAGAAVKIVSVSDFRIAVESA
jgi:membrane-bound ClpP family serine protease